MLLAVARSLLDRQPASPARAFESEGGFTKRLYRIRAQGRKTGPSGLPTRSTSSTDS